MDEKLNKHISKVQLPNEQVYNVVPEAVKNGEYVINSPVLSADTEFVVTSQNQTITGAKTFTNSAGVVVGKKSTSGSVHGDAFTQIEGTKFSIYEGDTFSGQDDYVITDYRRDGIYYGLTHPLEDYRLLFPAKSGTIATTDDLPSPAVEIEASQAELEGLFAVFADQAVSASSTLVSAPASITSDYIKIYITADNEKMYVATLGKYDLMSTDPSYMNVYCATYSSVDNNGHKDEITFYYEAVSKTFNLIRSKDDNMVVLSGASGSIDNIATVLAMSLRGGVKHDGEFMNIVSATATTMVFESSSLENDKSTLKKGRLTVTLDASSATWTYEKVNVASIPTKTSDLTNDSNYVSDASYVHTDNNYTTAEKNKLNGIASGAEVNVQADWNVTDSSSDAFIKNKPTIPTVNNGTLTIQGNGTTASTFTANQSGNTTLNIKGSGKTTVTKTANNEITISSNTDGGNADKVDGMHMLDQTYAYMGYLDISIGCVNAVVNKGLTEAQIFALTGNLYGKLYLASDTGKYWRRKNTQTTASANNWRDDTAAANTSLALPNQLTTTEDAVYIRLNVNQQYYSKLPKFFVEAMYDNVSGSTQITGFCRRQNDFEITSCNYNGNNLIGIYQESANTDKYIFKFTKFRSSYGAVSQLTITPRIYYNEASGTPTLTFIGSAHADYSKVKAYSYCSVPDFGIKGTAIYDTMLPRVSSANLGSSAKPWSNVYGTTLYENGTSLATKYQAKLPTTSTAGKVLKSTKTAGTVEWGDAPATGVTNVKINNDSIVDDGVATIQTNSTYNASTNKIATMSDVPSSFTVSVTDDILDGTGGANSVKYAPYSSKGAGHLYTGTTNPSSTNRLNYDGYLYATKLYSGAHEVLTSADKGTAAGNVPVLDSTGKLSESVIPAVAITDTYVVASETDMLGLSAQKGDIAIRSDLNKSFVLQSTPASTLENWKELLTPTDAVLSVNGKTGPVTLTASDVGASTSSHTHSFTPSGSVTLTNTASSGTKYVESITSNAVTGSPTTRYLHWNAGTTPKSGATPNHTPTDTGANSGTAVDAVTGYPSFNGGSATHTQKYLHHTHTSASLGDPSTGTVGISGGSGSLTSDNTATNGIAYIASASHTAASLGTASKSNAAAEGHKHSYDKATGVDLGSNSTPTGGVAYVESISSTGASGDYKYMHWSAGTTPKSGATPSHESKNTGTATTITSVTGKYLTISRTTGGTGTSARRTLTFTPAASSTTSGAAMNMAYVESGTSGTHTHTYDKTTSVSLTAGTAPSLVFNTTASGGEKYCTNVKNGTTSATTKYFHPTISTTSTSTSANDGTAVAAVTGYPSFNGGSATHTTKYLHHTHTGASLTGTKTFVTGYPNFNGGSGSLTSNSTSTDGIIYVESASHTPATLGDPSTSSVAPSAHTHTYDKTTSVSLTAGTAPSLTANSTSASALATYLQAYSVSGGGATATTKYMNATFTGSSGTTSTPSGTAGTPYSADSVQYIADASQITGPNTDGLKFVVTTTEPATKYDGYYYIVKES